MKLRCPNCGASHSLDSLLANDDAREALKHLITLGGEVSALTVRYLGLFRPAKSELSFARLASLLGDLIPDMQAQRITRNGQVYEAPAAAWLNAIRVMLDKRDRGELELPLKSHGYLYEVISKMRLGDTAVLTKAPEAGIALPRQANSSAAAVFAGRRQ